MSKIDRHGQVVVKNSSTPSNSYSFTQLFCLGKWLSKMKYSKNPLSGFRLIGFLYIGYFRGNQPESVSKKNVRDLLTMMKYITERKLNLRHTTYTGK